MTPRWWAGPAAGEVAWCHFPDDIRPRPKPRPALIPAAFDAVGLRYDTKFNLRQALDLPFTTEWFSVPPAAPHGQSPKLGTLHPSLVHAVQAAYRATAE